MDSSDPEITFDERGFCNNCNSAIELLKTRWFPNQIGEVKLKEILNKIKIKQKGRRYDCVMGLSGGVDSSYLLYLATKVWNLNVLAIHVNAGWNSAIAEGNIERLVRKLNVDLYTYVVDWEEMKELQLAYLRSGVINQDVPQDHVFFAQLYKQAIKEKVRFVLTGHNLATESIMPLSWGYNAMDLKQLKHIFKTFSKGKLQSYTTISLLKKITYSVLYKQKVIKPLDFITYNKDVAKKFLREEFGWEDYGIKHGESVFTRFFQNYWLPVRYGFDKRKPHLSSMIITGFITRENALDILKEPLYDDNQLKLDKEYICNKLEISLEELNDFLHLPKIPHTFYASGDRLFKLVLKIRNFIIK